MTVKLLEDTPAVLSLEKICEDHGYSYESTCGQLPHLTKNGRRYDVVRKNYVPLVPGLATGSSSSTSPTSPTSFSQDSVNSTKRPATIRSESMRERERAHGDSEIARGDLLSGLPDWLQEFKENLVDERIPEFRGAPVSSSLKEPARKEVPGKHRIYTHFPKDWNCEICKRTKITRALCR